MSAPVVLGAAARAAIARAEARAREVADMLADERLGDAYPYVTPHRAREIRAEIERDRRVVKLMT